MKSFRNRLAVVLSALILILGTGCPQPVEPETDYSADVAAAKSSLAIEFASGDSATSITQDITLPAKVGDVSVKWSSSNTAVISNDGDVVRPAFADGNTNVTLTATLSKGTASDTKAFNVTVLALAPYSYTVTFDSQNADTAANPSSIVVTEPATTVASLPTAPVKSGFEFGGWFTKANGEGTAFTTSTVVNGNITVYAKWTAVAPVDTSAQDVASLKSTLAISFADGDSTTSVTKNITLPTGSNGVNVSWSSTNTSVVSTAGIVTRPAFADGNASVTLTATLTKGTASDTKAFSLTVLAVAPYSYTVTFDSQNADTAASPASITVTEPATTVASLPTAPVKSGFEFGGWFTKANGEGTAFTASTVVSGNITVYAKWTATTPVDTSAEDVAAVKSALTLTFASGDSATSVTGNITLPSGSNGVNVTWSSSNANVVSTSGVVTRPAFTNGNASVTLTATLSKGTASDTKAFNVTVLALAPYSYTITFDSQNADTAANPSSIVVTEPATTVSSLPSAPEKSGFTFGGWFTKANGEGTAFTASTVVSGNITVYAKWTAVIPTTQYAYALDNSGYLYKREIASKSSWEQIDYNFLSSPVSLSISRNYAYALNDSGYLCKREITSESSWEQIDYNFLSSPVSLSISGNYTYALNDSGYLCKRNIASESSWEQIDYNFLSSPVSLSISE